MRNITVIIMFIIATLLLIGCGTVVSRVSDSIDDLRQDASGPTAGPLESSSSDYVTKGNRYYIDSVAGDDDNDGLSPETAWQSHTMVNSVLFQPGDMIAFKNGSQFSGPIAFTESGTETEPIVITSYGEGHKPRFTNLDDLNMNGNAIRLSGSWLIVDGLHFHDTPPTRIPNRLRSIFLTGAVLNAEGANHNIIQNNTFTNVTKGIQSTGEFTLITHNYIEGVDFPLWWNGGEDGWGPMGIQLGIGNQEVSYNIIKGFLTTDSGYGSDGGAIELDDGRYHKDNFYIHHNYSEGNAGFIESSWLYDFLPSVQEVHNLRVAFNVNFDAQSWLYMWAPCRDCYFDNNTVIRFNDFGSPLDDGAYMDYSGINFRNNLYVYTSDAYQGPGTEGIVPSNNWYFNYDDADADHWDENQAGSGEPGLTDLDNGGFDLERDSPLRGQGMNLSQFYQVDFNGTTLPTDGSWDIGALQYR